MTRGHVELVHARDIALGELPAGGWPAGVRVRILSRDDQSGALTGVVELPAGWRRPAGHLVCESEWFLLGGSLRVGERMRGFGHYEYAPAGVVVPAWSTEAGCRLLLFARDREPRFVPGGAGDAADGGPGRIELDTEATPWSQSHIPGPAEGLLHKVLRLDERTGEMTVITTTIRAYDYPMLEFHDCVEEIYMIEGDIWLGNSGVMTAGSYFWRPPFITHGPFYSRTGSLMLVWVPSTLVNHVPLSASSTPEENLARFVAAGGERVIGDDTGVVAATEAV